MYRELEMDPVFGETRSIDCVQVGKSLLAHVKQSQHTLVFLLFNVSPILCRYGVKIRLPHSSVMTFLFHEGT